MIYLKTIIFAPYEVKFLNLNLLESYDFVDRYIICEFNRTHTGKKHDYIFGNYIKSFGRNVRKKIIYIRGDISDQVQSPKNSNFAHLYESLMRGYFVKEVALEDKDIVFAVDCDEILYKQCYPTILKKINWFSPIYRLKLRQFFYRINYLWKDKDIIAPVACRAEYYKYDDYPAKWRDEGLVTREYMGCHFSWCMSTSEMMEKIGSYAHGPEYKGIINETVLKNAIGKKTYPFDKSVDFRIKQLDIMNDRSYYPQSLYKNLHDFQKLIAK